MPARRPFPAFASRRHSLSKGLAVFRTFITGSLIAGLLAGTASADTLRDALVSSYHSNPTLTAQREALKATDAGVAIAKSGGRPQISGQVGLNQIGRAHV